MNTTKWTYEDWKKWGKETIKKYNQEKKEKNHILIMINGKTYNLPFMKDCSVKKIKEVKQLSNIGEFDTIDYVIDWLSDYIPRQLLEALSLGQLNELISAWCVGKYVCLDFDVDIDDDDDDENDDDDVDIFESVYCVDYIKTFCERQKEKGKIKNYTIYEECVENWLDCPQIKPRKFKVAVDDPQGFEHLFHVDFNVYRLY